MVKAVMDPEFGQSCLMKDNLLRSQMIQVESAEPDTMIWKALDTLKHTTGSVCPYNTWVGSWQEEISIKGSNGASPWIMWRCHVSSLYINYYNVSLGWSLYTGSTVHQLLQWVPWVVFIYRFHCTSTTTMCPLGGLYIQVPLYIIYYCVSLGWSLYTGSTVHQLLQRVTWVVFINRFHCTSTTTVCHLGGLYIQVPLYINYYSVFLGWSLYTGSTVHQLLQCVPWVVFIYRFHCTSTTTVCPLGGLYIQVPLYIN